VTAHALASELLTIFIIGVQSAPPPNILVISGTWCGDCVEQVPLMQKIAEANPEKIDIRFLDRDANRDITEKVRINGGDRVPAVIFMSEDFEFCALAGDRTLSRYRIIAQKRLGPRVPQELSRRIRTRSPRHWKTGSMNSNACN
jgi:thiol-disulfide isomerase/thioredoxin